MATGNTIPRDLAAEASRVTEPGSLDVARRVAAMDPPTRAAAAVQMAVEGAAYSDIAKVLDYETPAAAKKAVWNTIGDVEIDPQEVQRKRELMGRSLGKLLTSCMRRATNPHDPDHTTYVRTSLAIMDRQARLYGLDAPTNLVVHTPTQREIDAYVEQVRHIHLVAAGDLEADILEAEVVTDDERGGEAGAGAQAS
jgi:hypothetical protein